MTRALAGMVLALVAVGVMAADNAKDRDEGRAVRPKGLEGTWAYDSCIGFGVWTPLTELDRRFVVFTAKEVSYVNNDKMTAGRAYTARFDKHPQEIDFKYEINYLNKYNGLEKGIFRLEGDTLTICASFCGEERPTDFQTKGDPPRCVMVLNSTALRRSVAPSVIPPP